MSKAHPIILYAGSVELGQAFSTAAERLGWQVMLSADDLETLAMYMVYCPDITVVEWKSAFAEEVLFHLRSVDAELVILEQSTSDLESDCSVLLDAIVAHVGHTHLV
jgi:hypothetical protein